MAKKLPYTPNSRIKSALRQLWLRSRERAKRLKEDKYTCQKCGKKQSRAFSRIHSTTIFAPQDGPQSFGVQSDIMVVTDGYFLPFFL